MSAVKGEVSVFTLSFNQSRETYERTQDQGFNLGHVKLFKII